MTEMCIVIPEQRWRPESWQCDRRTQSMLSWLPLKMSPPFFTKLTNIQIRKQTFPMTFCLFSYSGTRPAKWKDVVFFRARVHAHRHSADESARAGPRRIVTPTSRARSSPSNQRRSLSTSAEVVAAHVASAFSRRGRGRARPRGVFCVAA